MIKIICIGKIKEKFFVDAIDEYKKRISKFHKLEIIEIPDEATNDDLVAIKKEKEKLIKVINPKEYNIALDINGRVFTSEELSKKIEETFISNSTITFIIGGSCGLHDDIKTICNLKLSFSKLTFPHQLFRVILLEQIYRSFKIINNESYHK